MTQEQAIEIVSAKLRAARNNETAFNAWFNDRCDASMAWDIAQALNARCEGCHVLTAFYALISEERN